MVNQRAKHKASVSAWVDWELKKRLQGIAERDGLNLTDVVNQILKEEVARYETKEGIKRDD